MFILTFLVVWQNQIRYTHYVLAFYMITLTKKLEIFFLQNYEIFYNISPLLSKQKSEKLLRAKHLRK